MTGQYVNALIVFRFKKFNLFKGVIELAKSLTGNDAQGKAKEKKTAAKSSAKQEAAIPDFEKIESSPGFRNLMKKKKMFLIPLSVLFLGLYLLFNIVISYTNWLDAPFIGDISWVWVFAFGLFAMTWILVTVYMKKAATFDEMADETLKEFDYYKEEKK